MAQLKYEIIKEWLQTEARKPGANVKMPTVREIQRHFGVSQAPVSKALQELESEGIIRRQQGAGITAVISGKKQIIEPEKHKAGTIFFAYPMYQSEILWDMLLTFEQSSIQDNIQLAHFRLSKGESLDGLIKAAANCENLKGIIINSGSERLPQETVNEFGHMRVPVVLADNQFKYNLPQNVFSLLPDSYYSGYTVTKYFIEKGHKNIGFVRNEPYSDNDESYRKGVKAALKETDDVKHFFFTKSIKSWANAAEEAQNLVIDNLDTIRNEQITGMIFCSTSGAFAALQTFTEQGFKVPEDISVIGSADYWYNRFANPALTSASCDYLQMLKDTYSIASGDFKDFPQVKLYKVKVIERKSVKHIAK